MTREEKLEQLKQSRNGVIILAEETKQKVFNEKMIPIVESTTTYKMKTTKIYEDFCEITFDVGDPHKEWLCTFTIRLNTDKQIEMTHGLPSFISAEDRPFIIERDKIIGKLWDYENEMAKVFEEVKQSQDKLIEMQFELNREIDHIEIEIEQEERQHYLDLTKVGSKWVYEWEQNSDHKRPMTIEKITEKLVFYNKPYSSWGDNSTRMKISEWVNLLKVGTIVAYEERENNNAKD